MSVCECLDNMDIPEEVRTWGEECLEPDDPYRVIGDELKNAGHKPSSRQ